MLSPDKRYNGVVTRAEWIESSKGTSGLQLDIETDDGMDHVSHVLWVTEKTKEYFARDMATLGVAEEKLSQGSFLAYELPSVVCGREITFGTHEEEYKGERRVKVAWIGERRASNPKGAAFAVAQMFSETDDGGMPAKPSAKGAAAQDTTGDNLTDDEIPF